MKWLMSNTPVAQVVLLISLIGTIWGFYTYGVGWDTLGVAILGYALYIGIGISATFHRLLCHRSYKTYKIVEYIGTLLGTFANTGSSIAWVGVHMNHHRHSDTERDPHSPVHKGLKTFLYFYEVDPKVKWKMKHLLGSKFHRFLYKYHFAVLAAWSLLLFVIGGWKLMIFLHWMPMILAGVMSNITNYVGHMDNFFGGYRRYDTRDHSVNNWLWAIPTFGETWHNNHHKHPYSYMHGDKWWEVDLGGLYVKLIKTE